MASGKKGNLRQLGEFGLIERFQKKLQTKSPVVLQGIGDDCAVYQASRDRYQIITTDALVEGVHFNMDSHPPLLLGRKALAVSLSDIASMGGTPLTAVITLGIPNTLPLRFLDRLYEGLHSQCEEFGVVIAGGDTVRSPKGFWISLTLVGEVRKNRVFKRSGAKTGHRIMVTGTLGDSALGLKLLGSSGKRLKVPRKARQALVSRHQDPTPRVAFAKALSTSGIRISSMIDISDGLEQDLGHICQLSKRGADLYLDSLPNSDELTLVCKNNNLDPISFSIDGGEDYELLFTTPVEDVKKLRRISSKADVPVIEIGKITSNRGKIRLLNNDESPEIRKTTSGFDHFR